MTSPGTAPTREDRWLAAGLFGASFFALFATQAQVGFVRDESVYFNAAESYARWFVLLFQHPAVALTDASIVSAWDVNHEHPALMKTLYGLSYLLFHEALGWLKPAAAFRVPAFAVASLVPALAYLFGKGLYGRRAGLFAAVSFFLVPRQYFNAQLACFDMPVAAFWLLTVYTFWRAQTERRFWLYCGLAFGVTLATKHNALFLPFVLGPFALWRGFLLTQERPPARLLVQQLLLAFTGAAFLYGILWVVLGPERCQSGFALLSPHTAIFLCLVLVAGWLLWRLGQEEAGAFRALAPIAAMAVAGPLIWFVHWPYLWHHPSERTAWYLAFHATHNHYTWFYLGKLLRAPPFPLEYVVVKTALTVPLSLLLPMALGYFTLLARGALGWVPRLEATLPRPSFDEWLLLANATAAIAIISHPDVPHFGGVKHWLPSMPFLGVLAGRSVNRALDAARAKMPGVHRWAIDGALFGLLLAPAAIASVRIHPYGTSSYAELAGGVPGAASLGMQRQFWSNNVTGVLPWLNEHVPLHARVYLHEVNGLSFRDYQRNGMLRPDILPAGGPLDAQFAAYQYHQEFREHELNIWQAFGTQKPVYGLYLDETPQVVVYQRP